VAFNDIILRVKRKSKYRYYARGQRSLWYEKHIGDLETDCMVIRVRIQKCGNQLQTYEKTFEPVTSPFGGT
jgi:hypothetical protein